MIYEGHARTAAVKTISPFFDTWLQAFLVYAHKFNRSIDIQADRPTDRPTGRSHILYGPVLTLGKIPR